MKAHELATLNETRAENRELKSTCEGLRRENARLAGKVRDGSTPNRPLQVARQAQM